MEWQARQDKARQQILKLEKIPVTAALKEIQRDDLLHLMEEGAGRSRRAVVLYMDQGDTGRIQREKCQVSCFSRTAAT